MSPWEAATQIFQPPGPGRGGGSIGLIAGNEGMKNHFWLMIYNFFLPGLKSHENFIKRSSLCSKESVLCCSPIRRRSTAKGTDIRDDNVASPS